MSNEPTTEGGSTMSVAPSGARQHADMHPATKARVDAGAEVGRRLAALTDAARDEGERIVTRQYVERKRAELEQSLAFLVEAAQAEGAYGFDVAEAAEAAMKPCRTVLERRVGMGPRGYDIADEIATAIHDGLRRYTAKDAAS